MINIINWSRTVLGTMAIGGMGTLGKYAVDNYVAVQHAKIASNEKIEQWYIDLEKTEQTNNRKDNEEFNSSFKDLVKAFK